MRDSQIVKDYSEYSGLSIDEIISKTDDAVAINRDSYNSYGSSYDFYEKSKTYVFDLLRANHNEAALVDKINLFSPSFMFDICSRREGSFLEFGGGLGVFCEAVKRRTSLDVTYCDIKTHVSDFTLWRYEKHNVPVNTLIIPQEDFTLEKKYDIIFTDAVIEHMEPEQQKKTIKKLGSSLNKFGLLTLLIDLEGNTPDMPMRYNVDIVELHNILASEKLSCIYGRNTFSSRWVKI